ncbi:SDR family NAD(P)-dependent oxidoreductase [Yinghuangia seranimata]|uniref:SDR family NAD(P)-dependent oxidoreductase n=1 Tax=Yinghuangia seranimata TaxID=408067 RepID=UPI00248C0A3F|nr:SDR family NAD(P)-dependent oxidoreductase [Yinghuangia seranimata]MDI2125429.1 SDR family NAD(P)-dependent oxidoreductase [Yinghuangia seranimata]
MSDAKASAPGLVLVTGASSGIGLELAAEFAARDWDLVVCAEDAEIERAAEQLAALGGGRVTAVRQDLRGYDGVERLWAAACEDGRSPTVAVLNAGVGRGGPFVENDLRDELDVIALNCASTVHLAKRVLAEMKRRGEGKVLVTSSATATMPGAFEAVYTASTSFVQSFALAVRNELKGTGVTVTLLMPGATDTEFFERADMLDTPVGHGRKDDPAEVARQGYEALMDGMERVVAGSLRVKAQSAAASVLPDSVKAHMHRRLAEPDSDKG